MKWTYDWLKDYLKTDLSATEIADVLTRIGLEVEDLSTPIAPIAAKIVECAAHENSDHLHVLMVDDGTGTLRQVVCGAPNVRAGVKVLVKNSFLSCFLLSSSRLRVLFLSSSLSCS